MHQIIADILKVRKVDRYLEIGVGVGFNILDMPVQDRTGIDPAPNICSRRNEFRFLDGNSHDVLRSMSASERFDLIFIDGLHQYRHAVIDVQLSGPHLADGGLMVVHDVNPLNCPDSVSAVPRVSGRWCGDVWKVVPHILYKMSGWCGRTIPRFPGWFIVWRDDGSGVCHSDALRDVDLQSEYPFADKSINWIRQHRELMNFEEKDKVLKLCAK